MSQPKHKAKSERRRIEEMPGRKRKAKPIGAPRTEVFAMRLDPKLKYLAEIAARKQRRSLASFVEWAIELGLRNTRLGLDPNHSVTVSENAEALWDIEEADRLANLAFAAPDLLTYDEQILWKLIRETGYLWKARRDSHLEWQWETRSDTLRRDRLRQCWSVLHQVAAGQANSDVLPQVSKQQKIAAKPGDSNDDRYH